MLLRSRDQNPADIPQDQPLLPEKSLQVGGWRQPCREKQGEKTRRFTPDSRMSLAAAAPALGAEFLVKMAVAHNLAQYLRLKTLIRKEARFQSTEKGDQNAKGKTG